MLGCIINTVMIFLWQTTNVMKPYPVSSAVVRLRGLYRYPLNAWNVCGYQGYNIRIGSYKQNILIGYARGSRVRYRIPGSLWCWNKLLYRHENNLRTSHIYDSYIYFIYFITNMQRYHIILYNPMHIYI